MQDFCEEIRLKDDTSVLDAFTKKGTSAKVKHTSYEKKIHRREVVRFDEEKVVSVVSVVSV